jgi:hypothetical protein
MQHWLGLWADALSRAIARSMTANQPGETLDGEPNHSRLAAFDQRSDLNVARSSSVNAAGCSQAAKCPPLGMRP